MTTREEMIEAVERHERKCWGCIQAGVGQCDHLRDRRVEERLFRPLPVAGVYSNLIATAESPLGPAANERLSPIEVRLLEAFWRRGLDPKQQYRVAGYVVDFAFPDTRLVVEADGAEFHADARRESRRDAAIQRAGWHVHHFTGSQINTDPDGCVAAVYHLAHFNPHR